MVGAAIEAIETGRRIVMRKTAAVTITLPWDLMHRIAEIADERNTTFSQEVARKIQQGFAYEKMMDIQIAESKLKKVEIEI